MNDRPEGAGGGQAEHRALVHPPDGEGERVVARAAAAVAHVAADQREDGVLARVQGGERADAKAGRVVGDDEDRARRAHASASS